MALKEYLQDVFQQTHHLDLEELREDEQTAGKAARPQDPRVPWPAFLMYVAEMDRCRSTCPSCASWTVST